MFPNFLKCQEPFSPSRHYMCVALTSACALCWADADDYGEQNDHKTAGAPCSRLIGSSCRREMRLRERKRWSSRAAPCGPETWTNCVKFLIKRDAKEHTHTRSIAPLQLRERKSYQAQGVCKRWNNFVLVLSFDILAPLRERNGWAACF